MSSLPADRHHNLVVKPEGKHSAGNPHAMFDVAGIGNVY